ncbi:SUMO-interacting motif-containing protein 1 isoform X2 [Tiliqua scincoides]|uniref:SUMO-interacting motif-containing protein 1 isoform X2 n=1 Tax=Tiliqua scincoides TaxID=71010 RepID=UPI0034634285
MAEGVVVIAESSSDGDSSEGSVGAGRHRSLRRRKRRRRGLQEPAEIIDLTGDDMVVITAVSNNLDIFDLTETKETIVSPFHTAVNQKCSTPISMQPVCSPKILCTTDFENKVDIPLGLWDRDCEQPSPTEGAMKQTYFQSGFSLISNYSVDSESSSYTTYNSDLGSLGSPQVPSDVFSFSSTNDNSEHPMFLDHIEEGPSSCPPEEDPNPHLSPHHQRQFPSPISRCSPDVSVPTSPTEAYQPLLVANNSTSGAVSPGIQEPSEQIDLKIWVKTLQYFPRVPVHHPFLQNVVQEKGARQNKPWKPQPIPSQRLSMVSSTIEENFFQGTLDFLMDYVSCRYYPPKEITFCVLRRILLSPEQQEIQQEILKDAYMLLLKIQALHPATADTVVWDWQLLREVMEEQKAKFPGRLLFLQYVIQTLEDDFQRTAKTGVLHKSIAKTILSCDKCSSNVKEVIEWLVAAITGIRFSQHRRLLQKPLSPQLEASGAKSSTLAPELHLDQTMQTDETLLQLQSQKEVALLQRMLSIAVEVDKSPNCSAWKPS